VLLPHARRWPSLLTVAIGAAYAVTMIQFVNANRLTTAANAILLQATGPLHLLYLAPWLLRERIARADLGWFAILGVAMVMFFVDAHAPSARTPNPLLGNLLAASSGLTWALTVVGLRWLATGGAQQEAMAASVLTGNVIAAGLCLPFSLPLPDPMPATEWLIVGYLGSCQIGIAYSLLISGIARVPVFAASLLMLAENALNPFFVWLLHGEIPGRWALGGGAIIVVSAVARAWREARQRTAATVTVPLEV
jgi:drug/metabolite transporter (DMT)-like permease